MRKSQFLQTKGTLDEEAKAKHGKVKDHSRSLIERKHKMAEYSLLRAYHNYRMKVENERLMIESFNVSDGR
jgi:hypothetical protein